MRKILEQLECERLQDYVKILTGYGWPVSFERHVQQRGITVKELQSLPRLSELAKHHLNLTHYDLVKGVIPVLQSLDVSC